MNRVLVVSEKHGTRYFDASTDKLVAQTALQLLTERHENSWYINPGEPSKPDFNEDAIATLPDSMKLLAANAYRDYKRRLAEYRDSLNEYAAIERAIATKDGMLAWNILWNRSSYQYERVEIMNVFVASVDIKWPPIPNGTKVVTTHSHTHRGENVPPEILGIRRWGVAGVVTNYTDIYGLRYTISINDLEHGSYKANEFRIQEDL